MWSESEIRNCKKFFLYKMLNRDSYKMPPELVAYIIVKTEKVIDEFFEKAKNMDSSEIRRIEQKLH